MDVLKLVDMNPDHFSDEFCDWIRENKHIWLAFHKEADRVRSAGRKHYSARTIVEYLRHHSAVSEKNSTWKINDHCVPYLGRLYVLAVPSAQDFFEFRKINPRNKQKSLF
jgi:hypothetical protein